jgi:pyruvate, water dikinase
MDKSSMFVLWFDQLNNDDVPYVGGKNASLGEMYSNLTQKGIRVPNGFAVTAYAYRYFLEKAGIKNKIREILSDLDTSDMQNLSDRGHRVRDTILKAEFPQELKSAILSAYRDLCGAYNKDRSDTDVAVRSSATAEDLPDASFAGQQESYLNVRGDSYVLEACKKCIASLFTNRAISYRVDRKFDHFSIALSIGVQKMVRSDLACSGVMFSIDTESGFKDAVLINGSYGLGENIVLGAVNPDEFYVYKPTLRQGFKPIIAKNVGSKQQRLVYDTQGTKPTKNISVPEEERVKFCLTDDEVLTLARWACAIEDHYSWKAGRQKPMDMEWAKDGQTGLLFIVQARPETVQSRKDITKMITYVLKEKGNVIVKGKSVGSRIGQGTANVIKSVKDIGLFKKGEVLITEMTDPDWEPIMKIASAIVTNRGGRTCHAAIISRELGIPCVVGTTEGTDKIKPGQNVTVDCSQGDEGFVYEGQLKFEINSLDLGSLPKPKTHIMMNVADPSQAFELSFLPNDGIGLVREEFVLNNTIAVHPLALLGYDNLKDLDAKQKIAKLTAAYQSKRQFYVEKLAQGVGMIAAAFHPKPVIVRLSDFKSNEYANLIGGKEFEPKEDNPMIGWRGASRYYDPKYIKGFEMECEALLKVRNEFGLKNIIILIPVCRTIEEGNKILKVMADNGLVRGQDGLKVYCMCEIPSNVILAEQFMDIFDGFSIGSNDLTQMTLGVDRDSEIVSHVFNERNDAVKTLIKTAIDVCNRRGKYIGICGDAPSTYPEFAKFVVEAGIQSISLTSDTVIKTTKMVVDVEKNMGR